jgi:glycosidase
VDPKKALTGQFDFPIRLNVTNTVLRREGSMEDLDGFLDSNDNFYGPGAVMSTFIGNHDLPRVIHQAEDTPKWGVHFNDKAAGWSNLPGLPSGMSAFERVANGFTVLFTTKGIPLIYYGDEIGLPGAPDPDNRRAMQWSGYSAGQQYLKDHISKLGAIRAAHPALSQGTRSKLSVSKDTYAYKMANATDTVYVAINRSDSGQSVGGLPSGSLTDLLTGAMVTGPSINVPARHAMILVTP